MQEKFELSSGEFPFFTEDDDADVFVPRREEHIPAAAVEIAVQEAPGNPGVAEEHAAVPPLETAESRPQEEKLSFTPDEVREEGASGVSAGEKKKKLPPVKPFVPPPSRFRLPQNWTPTPEYGAFFRRAREANNLSLSDLAKITRIKAGYLEALEQENYKELPGVAYILAYIRSLADCYGMDAESVKILTSEVRKNQEFEMPEENKAVVGYERSDENPILLRRILLIGAGCIVSLAVLITLLVLFWTSGGSEPAGGSGTVQGGAPDGPDEERLVEMQPAPALQSHVLPVPSRRR